MNLCRACLCSDSELFMYDDSFASNYNLLTNLNVTPLDGKSQQFCHTCMETVNYFIQFRNKCTSADLMQQKIWTNQADIVKSEKLVQDDSQIDIKGEIKQENYDSSHEVEFDAKQEHDDDDEYEIKTENEYDLLDRRPRKRLKKTKPISKKIKDEKCPNFNTLHENYTKIISDNPACGLCGKLFNDKRMLNKHLEDHQTDRCCQLCPSTRFEHWPQLLAHRVLHTTKGQQCHLCDQKFRSHTHLEFHYWKVHCGVNNATLKCTICSSAFSTPRKLSKHIWRQHSQQMYVCDICSKVYYNKQMLKVHLAGHSDERRFVCDLCGYSSKFFTGLKAHNIRKHSPQKCICRNCERPFANPEKMAQHVCKENSKVCPICGKKLRKGLARHLVTHGAERRFRCARCPATYRSRGALKVHNDKHDNNPTQQCEVCHARFYSPSVLVKHRRVHTGEKPYACTKCHMRFTANHNLKVHMKVHGEMLIVKKNAETEPIFDVTKE